MAALAPAGNRAPRVQARTIRPIEIAQEDTLQRIAAIMRDSALTRHQIDFERVDRRAEALSHLRGTIVDLKTRMEHKSGENARLSLADAGQLSYKAS